MKEAVIVAGARTAVGRAKRGSLKDVHPVDMGAAVVSNLLGRVPQLNPADIEDIIIGNAVPEAEQGMNMARLIGLRAGLPTNVSGITVNRFCSSGLQTIAYAAHQIMVGGADVIVAGGVESMSLLPMTGHKVALNPTLVETMPEAYMGMGHTAEEVAKRYRISREDQDAFALRSHQRAAAALAAGKFSGEIVPITVKSHYLDENHKLHVQERVFDTDEGVRADTSLEALAKLKPVFHVKGSVTAGNSSQTSDGAAAVLVMSAEKAAELGVQPIAKFRSFTVGGVDPDVMGIGPVVAIPKALKMAGLSIADVDLFELNEAFASQSLAVIRELGLDEEKVNVNGGAIALGHPLGCTGAKLTVSLLNELKRRDGKYGVVTMCIGGGMGAAGVFEMV
ncbi:acetyl-CoA C-acetyltransferase [Brevibacillus borstelensis]|uniref:acetyl-CoA C-acetyltransferase n=1 Tax=Brevibacillus borstelensis TaxID=45462 RepID=UPI000F08C72E|nr:acetyl-CoA C-acetyltransferase [Brevibacillus borstelensis]MED1883297.1 acetyl-CoA C-acetyltransferase [Brevibacillus borstelensis]NOU54219.1 acetyl-CoA C-acetyltransferase [Brevibacillus borstelensis]RNB65690.1 acetyl-CoA C-acetyltransferase [Brevibacillus borstelensis]WNF06696.1 acetyl-CoA C-acetyltransferase [Brevibacillus borstelensis]GED53862.1 acetyl-CoA acetyltransferase [Brevibacillus borstelensis]